MKTTFKLLTVEQKFALAASLFMAVAFIAAIYFFRRLSNSDLFSFTPVLVLLAVSVPAGIFGIVFVQVNASEQRQAAGGLAQNATPVRLEARRTANVSLESAAPAKD